jgi:hypothetical protein
MWDFFWLNECSPWRDIHNTYVDGVTIGSGLYGMATKDYFKFSSGILIFVLQNSKPLLGEKIKSPDRRMLC